MPPKWLSRCVRFLRQLRSLTAEGDRKRARLWSPGKCRFAAKAAASLSSMWSLSADDEASLREISGAVHDAYLHGALEHDQVAGVVVVPLLQEGWPRGSPAERVLTHETWRYREYRITFFRGRLIVRRVRAVHEPDGWTDENMIYSVDSDPQANQVRVCSTECLRLTVDAIDVEVEVSPEPGGHVRRRVGKVTRIESDAWLDQRP
jgi:hypothetical protein